MSQKMITVFREPLTSFDPEAFMGLSSRNVRAFSRFGEKTFSKVSPPWRNFCKRLSLSCTMSWGSQVRFPFWGDIVGHETPDSQG